ncbi:MAG: bifunctional DNA-formamidopyrimidine glycosylase/DNA-(apurinic or apyrimidinic site) lyase [Candidatus Omnitrophica bacterium]|nr:bifunctional DNA-formamidopyrimidine glycosylase/DNA-(apurinic or apyrimidinic site) lyase [Candidatus Omnitrophota bacterium]
MPELPEVETIKRELERVLIGKKIAAVIVNNPKVIREPQRAAFLKGLKNVSIKKILRKGKLLIMELSSGKSLAIHLKMTGQLIYPGNAKKSRVSFRLSNGKILDFCDQRLFGELRLVDDWRSLKFVQELGPEPFALSSAQFKKMLSGKKTKIKPLLMDQKFICGVGNLYAAEALFRARIHPGMPAATIPEKKKEKLFKEIKDTLREAIKYRGSSVDQYRQVTGEPGSYVQYHKVYDRAGEPCLVCKAQVQRIALGGRGTYFCPKCQK